MENSKEIPKHKLSKPWYSQHKDIIALVGVLVALIAVVYVVYDHLTASPAIKPKTANNEPSLLVDKEDKTSKDSIGHGSGNIQHATFSAAGSNIAQGIGNNSSTVKRYYDYSKHYTTQYVGGLNSSDRELLEEATKELNAKNPRPALKKLTQLSRSYPKSAALHNNRGYALMQMHNHTAAVNEFTTAVKYSPHDLASQINLAMAQENSSVSILPLDETDTAYHIDWIVANRGAIPDNNQVNVEWNLKYLTDLQNRINIDNYQFCGLGSQTLMFADPYFQPSDPLKGYSITHLSQQARGEIDVTIRWGLNGTPLPNVKTFTFVLQQKTNGVLAWFPQISDKLSN